MHHTLRISEVLSHIFDYALLTPDDGRLSALRSLALTCKAFEDPALTILWRNMVSLVPLVKCLPEELWEIEIVNNGDSILVRSLVQHIITGITKKLLVVHQRLSRRLRCSQIGKIRTAHSTSQSWFRRHKFSRETGCRRSESSALSNGTDSSQPPHTGVD